MSLSSVLAKSETSRVSITAEAENIVNDKETPGVALIKKIAAAGHIVTDEKLCDSDHGAAFDAIPIFLPQSPKNPEFKRDRDELTTTKKSKTLLSWT